MEVEYHQVDIPCQVHSGIIKMNADTMHQAAIYPGSYVALTHENYENPSISLGRIQMDSIDNNTILSELDIEDGSILQFYPLYDRYIPTIEYIHLEWIGTSPPPSSDPMLSILIDGIFQDGMIWHCVSFGVDYGRWRCRLGVQSTMTCPNHSIPLKYIDLLRPFGVVKQTTLLAISHPSNSIFRIMEHIDLKPIDRDTTHSLEDLLAIHLEPSSPGFTSVLLQGPIDSGKKTTIQHVARNLNAKLILIDPTIVSHQKVSLEDEFLACFSAAIHLQPAVICLPHIELLFPKSLKGQVGSQRIADFCSAIHALQNSPTARVVVVGTVVSIDELFPKIRRVFMDEILMETTTLAFRRKLFNLVANKNAFDDSKVADGLLIQNGHQPGDIISMVNKGLNYLNLHGIEQSVESIVNAAKHYKNTTQQHHLVSVPNVKWDDIGGAEELKQILQEMVVWPFEKPEAFTRMGIAPPVGLLLYGPPGTGKTMLAKAAAHATLCNFMNVTASDIMSSEFGESEKAVARIFQTARAMSSSPCIIFLDEFQSLFANRASSGQIGSRMTSQLLQEIDSIRNLGRGDEKQYVFVLAATNCVNAIDGAFLQPGRFDNMVYVGHPDAPGRLKILELLRQQMPWDDDDEEMDLHDLVRDSEGLSSAEIISVGRLAALNALAMKQDKVSMDHLRQALITTLERYHI